jgi:hypothetical protein
MDLGIASYIADVESAKNIQKCNEQRDSDPFLGFGPSGLI